MRRSVNKNCLQYFLTEVVNVIFEKLYPLTFSRDKGNCFVCRRLGAYFVFTYNGALR